MDSIFKGKIKHFVVLFFCGFLMISCSKDNDDDIDVINEELEGKWTLTKVICFCAFDPNADFSGHRITFEGSQLKVENSGEYVYFKDAAGLFTMEGNVITFKDGSQYQYAVDGNKLTLSNLDDPQIADDEITFIYERS